MTSRKRIAQIISDVLSLVERYEAAEFRRAAVNVRLGIPEESANSLEPILLALEKMASSRTSQARDATLQDDGNDSAKGHGIEASDLLSSETEIVAMLTDEQFIRGRKELLTIAKRLFRVTLSSSFAKASTSRIVSWLVAQYRGLSRSERRRIYQSLRKAYLRSRSSTLSEWSDILASEN